jgi:hypothetical protein
MIRIAPIPQPAAATVVPLNPPARQIVLRQQWREGGAIGWAVGTLHAGVDLIDTEFGPFACRACAEQFAAGLNRAEQHAPGKAAIILRVAVRLREATSLADLAERLSAEEQSLSALIDADAAAFASDIAAPRNIALNDNRTTEPCA